MVITQTIEFATVEEEQALREIFLQYDMDMAGPVEHHVVMKEDHVILAGAMLSQLDSKMNFHLAVFAVTPERQHQNIGGKLLNGMMRRPWQYCRNAVKSPNGFYRLTTLAKGSAAKFYEKQGFIRCDFTSLAHPFDVQCQICPDRERCQPMPMMTERRTVI
ncbi:N-acetylglutamate synthase-like GNAT family acetyltransferase [Sporomusaceae bacterium BoRhaA]|uniref:GNAT family N-acetyltransferase n=1 Tax=Pelorhabdus rhamnosifermentans TaxID=2772457 RepID=UPI001C05FCEE|nr:GNAT family N-acetyltransferase [Pelorhabdus rhamnosifermentans]MBU2702353.1 N-acetylglutamate synthase-like GNAT family acetyltransferase [Pelorhabdus rhamnosifermentans]